MMKKITLCILLVFIFLISSCSKYTRTTLNQYIKQPEIKIIKIDSISMNTIGRLPWSRSKYTDLLKKLDIANNKPGLILFDIFFLSKKDPKVDAILAKQFKKNGNVFINYAISTEKKDLIKNLETVKAIIKRALPFQKNISPVSYHIETPIYSFFSHVKGCGPINVRRNSKNKMDRIALIDNLILKNGQVKISIPGFILEMALNYFKVKRRGISIKPGEYIQLSGATIPSKKDQIKRNIRIPIDDHGNLLLDFKKRKFKTVSFINVLTTPSVAMQLKDSHCIVGLHNKNPGYAIDSWDTPSGKMMGIELIALAWRSLLNKAYILEKKK